MARNVSDEELQLKKRARRRLVGAVVLVTAVAVVLPMILDSEPKPATQSIDIQIPSPDAGVLSSKPAPLKPAEPSTAASPPAEAPKAESPPEAKAENKPEAAVVARPEPKQEPKAEQKAETQPQKTVAPAKPAVKTETSAKAKTTGGFVIQVAALSDVAKARELQAKISVGGLKSYTEVVQTAKGPVTRVRVGPYASRDAAEKALPSLKRLQLDGKVVPR